RRRSSTARRRLRRWSAWASRTTSPKPSPSSPGRPAGSTAKSSMPTAALSNAPPQSPERTLMSNPKAILLTGASSGFRAMTVRALADAKHIVYAGMRDICGRNAPAAAAARRYADEHSVTLRPVQMDVSDQASVDGAVAAVLAEAGRIDVLVHNAGHM